MFGFRRITSTCNHLIKSILYNTTTICKFSAIHVGLSRTGWVYTICIHERLGLQIRFITYFLPYYRRITESNFFWRRQEKPIVRQLKGRAMSRLFRFPRQLWQSNTRQLSILAVLTTNIYFWFCFSGGFWKTKGFLIPCWLCARTCREELETTWHEN